MVRIFDREVAWELPSRSSAHADVVAALEPATEKLEAWRYSPIDDVSVASYAAVATETIDLGAARALLGAAGRSGEQMSSSGREVSSLRMRSRAPPWRAIVGPMS